MTRALSAQLLEAQAKGFEQLLLHSQIIRGRRPRPQSQEALFLCPLLNINVRRRLGQNARVRPELSQQSILGVHQIIP